MISTTQTSTEDLTVGSNSTSTTSTFIDDSSMTIVYLEDPYCKEEIIIREQSKKDEFDWNIPRKVNLPFNNIFNNIRRCCRNQLPYKIREVDS